MFSGMAEGGMANVVRKADALRQVFVRLVDAGEGAADGGHFHRMRQAGAVVVGHAVHEDLRLIFQPPETFAVQDAVAVAREARAQRVGLLRVVPPQTLGAAGGVGCQMGFFGGFPIFSRVIHKDGL